MKLPDLPIDGQPVKHFAKQVVNYLRSITITNVVGGKVRTSPSGTTIIIDAQQNGKIAKSIPAQFQTSASVEKITIAAGVLGSTAINKIEIADPDEGEWFVQSKVTIVEATGVITAEEIICTQTEESNTATQFYTTIAVATISETLPCTAYNSNYGPLIVFPVGNVVSTWDVLTF